MNPATLGNMPMKIKHSIKSGILFVMLIFGCATTAVTVAPDRIRAEMKSIVSEISLNRSSMKGLGGRRLGVTGFFYIVDADGIVVFHPRPALIGTSFRNHWFIKKIMEEKSGCLTYRLGNRTHVVYYERLNEEDEILCFSIVSDDLSAPPLDCPPADVR